jgi:hypothetical protein
VKKYTFSLSVEWVKIMVFFNKLFKNFLGKKSLLIFFLGSLLLGNILSTPPCFAMATDAGTSIAPDIFNVRYSATADGADISANVDIGNSVIVEPIYGFTVTPSITGTAAVDLSETAYFRHVIDNRSNTTAGITYSFENETTSWSAQIVQDDNQDGIHQDSEITIISSPISVNSISTSSIFLAFTAPAEYIFPTANVFLDLSMLQTPIGTYTGFNGVTYGAGDSVGITENAYSKGTPPTASFHVPARYAQDVVIDSSIYFEIQKTDIYLDQYSIDLIINNASVWGDLAITPTVNDGYAISYDPPSDFSYDSTINVTINALNTLGAAMQPDAYYFATTAAPPTSVNVDLTVFLQGYYEHSSGVHKAATLNIQLRPTQNINSGPSKILTLDVSGNTGAVPVPGAESGNYYLVIMQQLSGEGIGVNHLVYVSSENINFIAGTTTINLTDTGSGYYYDPFISSKGYSSLYSEAASTRSLRGGDASGEHEVTILDIIRWDNAATSANAISRGQSGWGEDVNFNGDDYINTDDFGVWKKNDGFKTPLPEDD